MKLSPADPDEGNCVDLTLTRYSESQNHEEDHFVHTPWSLKTRRQSTSRHTSCTNTDERRWNGSIHNGCKRCHGKWCDDASRRLSPQSIRFATFNWTGRYRSSTAGGSFLQIKSWLTTGMCERYEQEDLDVPATSVWNPMLQPMLNLHSCSLTAKEFQYKLFKCLPGSIVINASWWQMDTRDWQIDQMDLDFLQQPRRNHVKEH